MEYMENLMALGGGDEPEMCLSAIQVHIDTISFDKVTRSVHQNVNTCTMRIACDS